MIKKLFKRVLPALLVVCMLLSATAFAATTYRIEVTLTGPDADGVTQTISGLSSKYGSLSSPLAAEVVQVVHNKLGEIETVYNRTGLRDIVYAGLRAFADGKLAWDEYVDAYVDDVTGQFKHTLRDLDSTFGDLSPNVVNRVSYLTKEGDTYVVTVTLRQNSPSAGGSDLQGGNAYDDCPERYLYDLDLSAWYHDGVHYCVEYGIMEGHADSTFGPDEALTRAQVAQILYNLEGRPAVAVEEIFDDVAVAAWYAEAITWASEAGVVLGYGNGNFGPEDPVTREQLAAMLYRYAQYKGRDVSVGENTNILSYDDAFSVAQWAMAAMQWACGDGIVNGVAQGSAMNLLPQSNATRAQAATMFMRYLQ